MSISRDEVRHVARLARLDLDEAEIAHMARDLGSILDYAARLKALPHADMEAADEDAMPLREDRVEPWPEPGAAVAAAPDAWEGLFRTPPVPERG